MQTVRPLAATVRRGPPATRSLLVNAALPLQAALNGIISHRETQRSQQCLNQSSEFLNLFRGRRILYYPQFRAIDRNVERIEHLPKA